MQKCHFINYEQNSVVFLISNGYFSGSFKLEVHVSSGIKLSSLTSDIFLAQFLASYIRLNCLLMSCDCRRSVALPHSAKG